MQIYHAVFAEITGLSETLHPSRTQNTHPTNLIFGQYIDQFNPCGGFETAYAQGFSFFSTIFPSRGVIFFRICMAHAELHRVKTKRHRTTGLRYSCLAWIDLGWTRVAT